MQTQRQRPWYLPCRRLCQRYSGNSDGHSLPLRAGLFILSWPCTPCPCQEKHPQATPSFVHPCLISSVVPSGEFCTIWIGFTCCMATISTTRIPQLIVDRNAVLYSRCPMNDMAATSGTSAQANSHATDQSSRMFQRLAISTRVAEPETS